MTTSLRTPRTPTRRQLEVLSFIAAYVAREHGSPSFTEIADGLGISVTAVSRHIANLIRCGRVSRKPFQHRSLRVMGLPAAQPPNSNAACR